MSDDILTLIVLISVFAGVALARFFRTLDGDLGRAARLPIVSGIVAGLVIRLLGVTGVLHLVLVGICLTAAALYVRLMGKESEPLDGMLLGAYTGATAALPLVLDANDSCLLAAECLLAASVAGYGITFASFHVADKVRQIIIDLVTAALAIAVAAMPLLLHRAGLEDRQILIGTASLIPLLGLASVFVSWSHVRAELRDEVSLGFLDEGDVRSTAHPFLRLGRGGWIDSRAHREFVRLANEIALRKRQQRERQGEMARLYQLEIMKLRMQIQQMAEIDRAARTRLSSPQEEHLPSMP